MDLLHWHHSAFLMYLTERQGFSKSPERIIVSSQGIEYYGSNFSLRTEWRNFELITRYRDVFGKYEGLTVDVGQIELIERRIKIMPVKIFIPFSLFANNWRNSELGRQVKQYAPHLFEK